MTVAPPSSSISASLSGSAPLPPADSGSARAQPNHGEEDDQDATPNAWEGQLSMAHREAVKDQSAARQAGGRRTMDSVPKAEEDHADTPVDDQLPLFGAGDDLSDLHAAFAKDARAAHDRMQLSSAPHPGLGAESRLGMGHQEFLGGTGTDSIQSGGGAVVDRPGVDLLAPSVLAGRGATLDGAPWLGLERSPAASSATTASVLSQGATEAAGVREALAVAMPDRLAHFREQATTAEVASLTRGLSATSSNESQATRALAEAVPQVAASDVRPADADAPEQPMFGEADEAPRRPVPAAPRAVARPAAPAPLMPPVLAETAVAPGGVAALPGAPTVTRVHTVNPAVIVDGRFADGQLPQQVSTPDLTRLELKVDDGDHALKVTMAREAEGLSVDVRAPREVVAELRALRPEVEAALADDGYDLTAYDAHEDPDAWASDAEDDIDLDETAPGTAAFEGDAAQHSDSGGAGNLFNRQA